MNIEVISVDTQGITHRSVVEEGDTLAVTITTKPDNEDQKEIKKEKICRYFKLDKKCKFGNDCWFYHQTDVKEENESVDRNGKQNMKIKVMENKTEETIENKNVISNFENEKPKKGHKKKKWKGKTCKFFESPMGCKYGDTCSLQHYRAIGDAGKTSSNEDETEAESALSVAEIHKPAPVECTEEQSLVCNASSFEKKESHQDKVLISEIELEKDISKRALATQHRSHNGDQENGHSLRKNLKEEISRHQNCRFFKKGTCKDGENCRFQHREATKSSKTQNKTNEIKTGKDFILSDTNKKELEESKMKAVENWISSSAKAEESKSRSSDTRTKCPYFAKGYCRQKSTCKLLHSNRNDETEFLTPELVDVNNSKIEEKTRKEKNCVKLDSEKTVQCKFFTTKRGCLKKFCPYLHKQKIQESHDLSDKVNDSNGEITEVQLLRETELKQLEKRFAGEERFCIIKKNPNTIYVVKVEPTDPDWGFVIKSFNLQVDFPEAYPVELFTVSLEDDEKYPDGFARFMNEELTLWYEEKSKTRPDNELSFRPFLRWFDRNLIGLFSKAALKVKKLQDAERDGITLVSYQELQKTNSVNIVSTEDNIHQQVNKLDGDSGIEQNGNTTSNENVRVDQKVIEEKTKEENGEKGNTNNTDNNTNNTNNTGSTVRMGTEVKFLALKLSEKIGIVKLQTVYLVVECERCKHRMDVKLLEKKTDTYFCEKCNSNISVIYHPELMHQHSSVVGYLHMNNCKAADLVLQRSVLNISCLDCSKEQVVKDVCYGDVSNQWCHNCHAKLDLTIEPAKFYYLKPEGVINQQHTKKEPPKRKAVKDPSIKDGEPLPDNGSCKHYKKSYRWLRFPCCGKAYPCDVCHDNKEDHTCDFASKMICGHCAKEQQYSVDKPCIRCKETMTRNRSAHWEGGRGNRNRLTMAKNDRQKTAGLGKTISRKKAGAASSGSKEK